MPKRQIEFINGEIYHIITRGVEQRRIFMNDQDYWRGIFSLYEFNDDSSVTIRDRRSKRISANRGRASVIFEEEGGRNTLVEILAFVFMPNHIHLLLCQEKEEGISRFLQKLNTGYARYFNEKYKRVGPLFQGRFKASRVEGNEYLKTLFVYIHTNPIGIIEPGWKERGIKDVEKAKEFLEDYRWSSYLDYLGHNNFPSLTKRDFLNNTFEEKERMISFVSDWINYKKA
ncbi:MAG: transposase [Candidatus Pacebacteria bacterium]|nr:transposase [Candidatus Paceibacterota bacterium]MDD4875448.1 transposase [Candidatus Paceibacterota bacterium]